MLEICPGRHGIRSPQGGGGGGVRTQARQTLEGDRAGSGQPAAPLREPAAAMPGNPETGMNRRKRERGCDSWRWWPHLERCTRLTRSHCSGGVTAASIVLTPVSFPSLQWRRRGTERFNHLPQVTRDCALEMGLDP